MSVKLLFNTSVTASCWLVLRFGSPAGGSLLIGIQADLTAKKMDKIKNLDSSQTQTEQMAEEHTLLWNALSECYSLDKLTCRMNNDCLFCTAATRDKHPVKHEFKKVHQSKKLPNNKIQFHSHVWQELVDDFNSETSVPLKDAVRSVLHW